MKNKKDIIDLLQNADEKTVERIADDYPQYDTQKADKLFREIERRVDGVNEPAETIEVSGVEHYRPMRFRRFASVAACLAIVGAGAGTAYGLSRSGRSGKSPASEVTSKAAVTSEAAAVTSNAATENTSLPTKAPSTSELTQESLYELMLDPLSHFDKCYIVYSSVDENSRSILAVSQSEGIYSIELSHVWDYSYKDKRISIPKNPNDKMIVENPSENLKERLFNKDSIINSYGDLSKWKITGTDTYLGRECALIEASYEDEIYFDPEEFKKTNGEQGREDVVYLIHVDLQTGIVLRVEVPTMGDGTVLTDASEVYFDEDAVSHITSPAEVREFIENGDYELEDGLTLDFLSEKSYEAATGTTADTTTEPTTETTTETTTESVTVTTVEATKAATTLETTIENGEPVTVPDMHIFEALDSLPYHAISCDGIPTHKLTAPDGTVYYLHLDEDSDYQYVWRRPSLISDPDNEATLDSDIINYIRKHYNELDIVELDHFS